MVPDRLGMVQVVRWGCATHSTLLVSAPGNHLPPNLTPYMGGPLPRMGGRPLREVIRKNYSQTTTGGGCMVSSRSKYTAYDFLSVVFCLFRPLGNARWRYHPENAAVCVFGSILRSKRYRCWIKRENIGENY